MAWWRRITPYHRVLMCVLLVCLVGIIVCLSARFDVALLWFIVGGGVASLVNFVVLIVGIVRASARPRKRPLRHWR